MLRKSNRADRARLRRKARIRRKVSGTAESPRISVFKSSRYTYVQAIDDIAGHTLAAVSTKPETEVAEATSTKSVDAASELGKSFARKLLELGVQRGVFDRSGYKYVGRIRAVGDGMREEGFRI